MTSPPEELTLVLARRKGLPSTEAAAGRVGAHFDRSATAAASALQQAPATREPVHTARGILMERHGTDAEAAMRRMVVVDAAASR